METGRRRRRVLLGAALVGLTAGLLATVLHVTHTTTRWENITWDWRARGLARPVAATDSICLVLIDQASLDWGWCENNLAWPWPREVYVPVLAFCRRAGARSVAFDLIFSEPSGYGVWDDEQLGASIAAEDDFVGAVHISDRTRQARCIDASAQPPPLLGWPVASVPGLADWIPDTPGVRATRATFPVPEIATSATFLGNVAEEPDADGVYRRATLLRVLGDRVVPGLGLAGFIVGEERPAGEPRPDSAAGSPMSLRDGHLEIAGRRIHIDDRGRAILRYRGGTGAFSTYSAAGIIQSQLRLEERDRLGAEGRDREAAAVPDPVIEPAALAGRHVLLAGSAPGLLDLRPTPLSPSAPGVVIHATVLDNLSTGDFMRPAAPVAVTLVTILLGVLAAVGTVMTRRAIQAIFAVGIGLSLPTALGIGGYVLGFWWPIVPGTLSVTCGLAGGLVIAYATEGRQRRFLRTAFGHYLSTEVITRLMQHPEQLQLGGERRELTIMFSDLEGFTSLGEALEPEALTTLLNDYLSEMTDIILEEGGTLDKYEGDAILAFWNAPLDQADHAVRACRTAVRCQRRLAEMRPAWRDRCGRDLNMRIGLHTGPVIVGNLGSRQRFDYTVLGDTANLASRLEGANKVFGTGVLVSGAVRDAAADELVVPATGLGRVRVVGRRESVPVFTLDERLPDATAACERALELCADGRAAEVAAVLADCSDDPFSRRLAERCRREPDFDGLWRLTEK